MRPRATGAWMVCGAGGLGLVLALSAYLRRGSGIDHTPGALLVCVSTALLAVAAAVLAFAPGPGWLRVLLIVLAGLDLAATAVAAWLLHSWVLVGLMVLGTVAWLMLATGRGFSGVERTA